jgi:hypothetical protein
VNIKIQFLRMANFILQDGEHIRFWEDRWLGTIVFEDQYPNLYNIVREKSAIVASVFNSRPLKISFRRNLVAENL